MDIMISNLYVGVFMISVNFYSKTVEHDYDYVLHSDYAIDLSYMAANNSIDMRIFGGTWHL